MMDLQLVATKRLARQDQLLRSEVHRHTNMHSALPQLRSDHVPGTSPSPGRNTDAQHTDTETRRAIGNHADQHTRTDDSVR